MHGTGLTLLPLSLSLSLYHHPNQVPKITRVLIQRIYNDPAFGLQGRVDAVLQPRPPLPPLPLSDYLENLGIVKEKLGALYVLYSAILF